MRTKKIIACISAFTMIMSSCPNFISSDEASPIIYGDVDGDGIPQINDLTKMSLNLLGDLTFNDNQKKAADVNADNDFNIADLATMKQYVMHDDIELGKPVSDSKNDVKFDVSKCNITNYRTSGPIENLPNKIPVIIKSMDDVSKYPCDIDEISSGLKLSNESFKDNTVIIVPVTFVSGSVDCEISNIEISADKKMTLEITSVEPLCQTADITNWHLAVSIPNKYLENVDLSKIDTNFIDKHLAAPDGEQAKTIRFNYDYNCVSINSHADFSTQERKLTVLNSTHYGMLDNIQIELGEEFGEICRALNISENIPEDDFYKENSLCILPCPKRSDFMGEQISSVTVDEEGVIDIQNICFDKDNTQSDSTGNILAFIIPNKYLTDNQITKLNVDCWNPNTYYYSCTIKKSKYENWDSKMQGKQTSAIISSVDELNEYEKQFSENAIKYFDARLINLHISEEYFKENVLVLAYVPESYAGTEDQITNIYLNKKNNLSVEILSDIPKTADCNVAQYHFAISIPKNVIGNADLSSLDINYIQHSLS